MRRGASLRLPALLAAAMGRAHFARRELAVDLVGEFPAQRQGIAAWLS